MNDTLPRVIGKIYILPLTIEQKKNISKVTKVTRDNTYPVGNYNFQIPKSEVLNLSDEDIMMACGFHPAGYGCAIEHTEDEQFVYFKCSGSCD